MMVARRVAIVLVTTVVCLLPFMWWGVWFGAEMARHDVWTVSGPTMGTEYTITSVTEWGRPWPEEVQPAIDARLAEINQRMSTYDPESELSSFNASEDGDWFPVSDETAVVVAAALELAAKSNGAFDPTVGPVVNLWGFGPGKRRRELPSNSEITEALASIGYQLVEVRTEPPAIRKLAVGVSIDLSAIAKGYAVDQVSDVLAEHGVVASMVEIGGEVVCRGTKPGGQPWRIGVQKPDATGRLLQAVLEPQDEAVATSGDYYNQFEHGQRRYSHTIDPNTGRPVTHRTASITVRAADCMTADALATALLVLGSGAGYDWAVEQGVAALFVSRTDDGYTERTTPAWEASSR